MIDYSWHWRVGDRCMVVRPDEYEGEIGTVEAVNETPEDREEVVLMVRFNDSMARHYVWLYRDALWGSQVNARPVVYVEPESTLSDFVQARLL